MWVKAPVLETVRKCEYEWVIKAERQRNRLLLSVCEVDLEGGGESALHFLVLVSSRRAFVTFWSCLYCQHLRACSFSCVCVCLVSESVNVSLRGEQASPSGSVLTSCLCLSFSLSIRSFHLPPTTCSLCVMKVTHVGVIDTQRARICVCVCLDWCVCQLLYATLPTKPKSCNQVCCL